jgi:CRISPR system Cascade subunit CasE
MTFGDVVFEGRLRVGDAEAFRRALAVGIGSGKAYGFGLLSVARAPA